MLNIDVAQASAPPAGLRGMMSSWFVFGGRIGRRQYWLLSITYLLALAVSGGALIWLAILLSEQSSPIVMLPFGAVAVVAIGALTVASMSVAVRRLHDRGKTGFWLLAYYIVPGWTAERAGFTGEGLVFLLLTIGIVVWSVVDLGILRGDRGSNAFGSDPLAENR